MNMIYVNADAGIPLFSTKGAAVHVRDFTGAASGDFDGNSVINGRDFLAWQRGAGVPNPSLADGDANGDGMVDSADLEVWQNQYGTAPITASIASYSASEIGFSEANLTAEVAQVTGVMPPFIAPVTTSEKQTSDLLTELITLELLSTDHPTNRILESTSLEYPQDLLTDAYSESGDSTEWPEFDEVYSQLGDSLSS